MRHVVLALIALCVIACSNQKGEVTTNVPPPQKQADLHQAHEVPAIPPPPPAPRSVSAPAMMPTGVVFGVEGGVMGGVPGGVVGGMVGAPQADVEHNTEEYGRFAENPFLRPGDDPLSTFSIDVDRASYANVRRFVQRGQRPPRDAVRIEEMVNYFTYDYPEPTSDPFSISTELAACPWNEKHRLLLIGLQGKRIKTRDLPPNNLVFLIDTSGSMQSPDKLPLVQAGLRLLVEQLRREDRVAIVTYAGSAGLVLPSTPGSNKSAIMAAIDELQAGGSTAGAEGIVLAYNVARENFLQRGNNRVILATDGDFNVGVTSDGELEQLIERKRRDRVFLTVLGFGSGNIKDSKMELLADKGNGNYAYIDSLSEARKTLVHEMGATLFTIAKDVKIQVEFNPSVVGAYRLIGYENRLLRSQDFNDDKKDAGELGAGHSVTALYEIVPPGEPVPGSVDPLKYQKVTSNAAPAELATVKLRYKDPDGDTSRLLTRTVAYNVNPMSDNLRLASAIAELGMLLRGSEHKGDASFDAVIERGRMQPELVALAERAKSVM
ncbi:MAG TPA: VWA domain-containing protein [Thermoanaerobaculia bacterium]|nr:VWA domain-containing protein [Thermoanaerobaculia bacterium]